MVIPLGQPIDEFTKVMRRLPSSPARSIFGFFPQSVQKMYLVELRKFEEHYTMLKVSICINLHLGLFQNEIYIYFGSHVYS